MTNNTEYTKMSKGRIVILEMLTLSLTDLDF